MFRVFFCANTDLKSVLKESPYTQLMLVKSLYSIFVHGYMRRLTVQSTQHVWFILWNLQCSSRITRKWVKAIIQNYTAAVVFVWLRVRDEEMFNKSWVIMDYGHFSWVLFCSPRRRWLLLQPVLYCWVGILLYTKCCNFNPVVSMQFIKW